MCSGVNVSSYYTVDTSLHAVTVSMNSTLLASVLDPFQNDCQTSNVLSQGFCDLDFNFPDCTFPSDTPSNSEYAPNLEELMPGIQSNDPSNPCDPIVQQMLGDIDIMDGDFNLKLNAIASDPNWSKSMESATCDLSPHTNFAACSIIPESGDHCSWYLPQTSHTDTCDHELNHEVHDILQQFM